MPRITRTAAAVAGVAALAAYGLSAPSASASGSHTLAGTVPAWANSSHQVGASSPSQKVIFRVYLNLRNADQAAAYALAVSTKGNPDYGKFLTPAQFHDRFSPTQASVDSVRSWLKSQGFTVGAVPGNRKYVEATGTLAQASTAFSTGFAQYSVDGATVRGNTKAFTVPDSLPQVQSIVGLDESQMLLQPSLKIPAPAGFRNATPCSTFWGQSTVQNTATPDSVVLPGVPSAFSPCGYSGAQLTGAYGVDTIHAAGNTGQNVTIGIIDAFASPTIESDANTYFAKHGIPTFTKGQFTQVVPPGIYNKPTNKKMDPTGWAGEETLDVEAAHTMAPGAHITYIGTPNNGRDMDATMNQVVDQHLADVVSNSYGYGGEALPTGTIKPSLDTQIQAAAEGISLFFSSGDSGDETGGSGAAASATPDWPASSPYVTAVGGTSLGIDANNRRVFETGWETAKSTLSKGAWTTPGYQYGSGGGTSRLFAQPSYQAGVVPDSVALGTTSGGRSQKMRVVPDVSAIGDPTTGMLVGETQQWSDGSVKYDEYRIGGTSLASPIYAGIFALAVHAAGYNYGLANPALYAAGSAAYDVTKSDLNTYPGAVRVDYVNGENASDGFAYSARWFDKDDSLTIHVRPGYDDVTGVGSPNGAVWFDKVVAYQR